VLKKPLSKPTHNRKDYTGLETFYLKALYFVEYKNHRSIWKFQCRCGVVKDISAYRVANGVIKSCGCIRDAHKATSFDSKLYGIYTRAATKRGYSFSLSKKQFLYITNLPCHYCNELPSDTCTYEYLVTNYSRDVNGLDRLDNSIGYTSSNCVPCCKVCNRMKSTMSFEEFVDKCKRITLNSNT